MREEGREGKRVDALTVKATAKTRAIQSLLAQREHDAVVAAKTEFRVRNPRVLDDYSAERIQELCDALHEAQRKRAVQLAKAKLVFAGREDDF